MIILILGNQIIVGRRITSPIELLLVPELLLLRRMDWMMAPTGTPEWHRADGCIVILIGTATRTQPCGASIFALMLCTLIDLLALDHVTAVVHILLDHALVGAEACVGIALSGTG